MERNKVLQVCKEDECDNHPVFDVQVGNKSHNFCCQKGFEKSLKDFSDYINGGAIKE